jgi:hypothetical protein
MKEQITNIMQESNPPMATMGCGYVIKAAPLKFFYAASMKPPIWRFHKRA